jgi:hypothetical protein
MMNAVTIAQLFALAGLAAAAGGLALRWRETSRRALPIDRAPAKGNVGNGVVYAFTLGMAPWSKESTRLHAVAYLRGVGFHAGIFLGLAALAFSPAWSFLPAVARQVLATVLALGALLGIAGLAMRVTEKRLSALSTADDYVSVALVSLFLVFVALAMWNSQFLAPMYGVSAVMLAYIPLGKIRHCLYFFFSRLFFGRFFGRRGVLPHPVSVPTRGAR